MHWEEVMGMWVGIRRNCVVVVDSKELPDTRHEMGMWVGREGGMRPSRSKTRTLSKLEE